MKSNAPRDDLPYCIMLKSIDSQDGYTPMFMNIPFKVRKILWIHDSWNLGSARRELRLKLILFQLAKTLTFVSYDSMNGEFTLYLIQDTWALTEKQDQATILLQANAAENDSNPLNPLNIKSESWQILTKLGMVDIDFKIDVVKTNCLSIPIKDTMRTTVSGVGVTEGTTTTETMEDLPILATTSTSTTTTTTSTTTTTTTSTTTSTTLATMAASISSTTSATTSTAIETTLSISESTEYIDCQTLSPETFYNGAQKCSNLGLRFPTISNLDLIKNKNEQFWIGARIIYEKWTDEFNNEIDPVQPVGTSFWSTIGRIFGLQNNFCLYWDKNRIQKVACDKRKPVHCCRDGSFSVTTTSAKQSVPTTRATATTPVTTVAATLPAISAMKITTTDALEFNDDAQKPKDEKLNILLTLSCFDPSWPVFDDRTLIKLRVLDRTKCLGICQRVDHCLAFSAQENFCVFKMSSSIENLKSVTAMLSAFIG